MLRSGWRTGFDSARATTGASRFGSGFGSGFASGLAFSAAGFRIAAISEPPVAPDTPPELLPPYALGRRLAKEGLLGPDHNIAHGNCFEEDELKIVLDAGCQF